MGSHASTDDRHTSDDQAVCVCVCVCAEGDTGVETILPSRSNNPPLSFSYCCILDRSFLGAPGRGGRGERKRGGCVTLEL